MQTNKELRLNILIGGVGDEEEALKLREELRCPVWDKPALQQGEKRSQEAELDLVEPFAAELQAWIDEKLAAELV